MRIRTCREQREELVSIGKDIVRKCGGSPLAARALGGVLRSRNEEKEWLEVKESRLWTFPEENDILSALRLSYFHLTPTLKQCFAFCAIFPEDTEIQKRDLIHLWMANGFISSRENLDVEDVDNMIWNELYQKAFFQDIQTFGSTGEIVFKMHDLIHDLAQSVAGQECMTSASADMTDLSKSTHHVGFGSFSNGNRLSFKKGTFENAESLRTLYQLYLPQHIYGCLPTNHSLRVLRINFCNISSLGNLTHLRYLEISDFDSLHFGPEMMIQRIPDSICRLQKLEILKLTGCYFLSSLPKHLTRLQNLRHLVITGCGSLYRMFPDIRKLCCRRTLSLYIVSMETGHSLAELRDLKLGGALCIKGLRNVRSLFEAQEANLKGKEDLRELELFWGNHFNDESRPSVTNAEEVLEALQPHSNLKSLKIFDYDGLRLPSWVGNNSDLSNLVDLQLDSFSNCQQLQSLGKLPSLKALKIEGMGIVQYVDADECCDGVKVSAFPSLEILYISRFPNLERLLEVERGDMFLRLSGLGISDCPKLGGLPCLPSLKLFDGYGCNNELLSSISSLKGLTHLRLGGAPGDTLTSFPEGMMTSLTCLKTLRIHSFYKLKELPFEIMKLSALEDLKIIRGDELESLPEHGWDGLCSLRRLEIWNCKGLRSLPEGVRHLTSLEVLSIYGCPELSKRCKEGTGEDWHKPAHLPKIT